MELKPVNSKYYKIRFKRGKDEQSTDVINTCDDELMKLICDIFSDRTVFPKSKAYYTSTKVYVTEYDNNARNARRLDFTYAGKFKESLFRYLAVKGLSPREARILFEKRVRSML